MREILGQNRGIALAVLAMLIVVLLSMSGATLLISGLNLKVASSFKTSGMALQVADAGIQHALAVIPSGGEFDSLLTGSVTAFPCASPCDGTSNKATLSGSLAGYTYNVVVEDDADGGSGNNATDDTNQIVMLTSTASGPNGTQRRVRIYLGRSGSGFAPPGAVYVPGDPLSDADFKTTGGILVTGDDTSYVDSDGDGAAESTSAGPQDSLYGIAAGNQGVVDEFLSEMNNTERSRVQGVGYDASTSPVTPSVGIASETVDVATLATNLVNQITATTCPPKCLNGLHWNQTDCPATAPCILGTDAAPQITYISEGTQHVHFDGYVYGAGILIVEGKAHFYRNFEFHGLVISLAPGALSDGTDEEKLKIKFKGNARIFGGLLLGPNQEKLKFDIKDQAAIYYSSQGLTKANQVGSCCLSSAPARVKAWQELMS